MRESVGEELERNRDKTKRGEKETRFAQLEMDQTKTKKSFLRIPHFHFDLPFS